MTRRGLYIRSMARSLRSRDQNSIWHPYTQHGLNPHSIGIVKGKGAWLYSEDGKKYLDATSSWWTSLHGHAHPYIARKVASQIKRLEHVIFAGFTHEPAVELSERLLTKLPDNQKRIFFSDNGSTAVEVALKMAFQYWYNKGLSKKKVIAFRNSYHGDTFGAMSVSERGAFTAPFDFGLWKDVLAVDAPLPGVDKIAAFKKIVQKHKNEIAAFIFEPMVQGVAGMVIQDPIQLNEMLRICRSNNILIIADEVFTGFGRTGRFFATDYLREKPDMFCLSKGLTGGTMAMGVTSSTSKIFEAFLSKDRGRTFFHGHSFTANPVACSAALASMDLLERSSTWKNIERISDRHQKFALEIIELKQVKEVRHLGTILAIELRSSAKTSYFNPIRDRAVKFFMERGLLLRPLGNVIYIVPPYCINEEEMNYVYKNVKSFIISLKG